MNVTSLAFPITICVAIGTSITQAGTFPPGDYTTCVSESGRIFAGVTVNSAGYIAEAYVRDEVFYPGSILVDGAGRRFSAERGSYDSRDWFEIDGSLKITEYRGEWHFSFDGYVVDIDHDAGTNLAESCTIIGNVLAPYVFDPSFADHRMTSLDVSHEAQQMDITVYNNQDLDWSISSDASWARSINTSSSLIDKFQLNLEENNTGVMRACTLQLISYGISQSITVTQYPFIPPQPSAKIVVEQPVGKVLINRASSVGFGRVTLGINEARTFIVRNTGEADLTGLAVSFSGDSASDFTCVDLATTSLASGSHAVIDVVFAPRVLGRRDAVLRITSNDEDEYPFDIALVGTGTVPAVPEITVKQGKGPNKELKDNKSNRDFGSVKLGQSSRAMVFLIKNEGKEPLTKLGVTIKGRQSKDFKIVKKPAKSVAPGKSTQCKVIFKPRKAKSTKTTLQISSNDKDENPFRVKISGNGVK